jgi:hypothetical protein
MATENDLREAYATMRANFPGWASKQDAQSVRIWGEMLNDVPGEALVSAIRSIALSSRFPPSVAEIREAAGCEDPSVVARRAASEAAAKRHEAWVAEQDRIALAQARANLRRSGIDPDNIKPVAISELLKGIGR